MPLQLSSSELFPRSSEGMSCKSSPASTEILHFCPLAGSAAELWLQPVHFTQVFSQDLMESSCRFCTNFSDKELLPRDVLRSCLYRDLLKELCPNFIPRSHEGSMLRELRSDLTLILTGSWSARDPSPFQTDLLKGSQVFSPLPR